MTALERLKMLDKNPKFVKLPYSGEGVTQTAIRRVLVQQALAEDPSIPRHPLVVKNLTYGVPALEDKRAQEEIRTLSLRAQGGDQEAIRRLQQISRVQGSAAGGIIGNLAARLTGAVAGAAGYKEVPLNYYIGNDGNKIEQYLNILKDFGPMTEKVTSGKGAFQAVSALADTTVMYAMVPNVLGDLAKAGLAIRGARAGTVAARLAGTRLGTVALRSLIPQAVETLAAGGMGLVQENLMAVLDRDPERYTNTVREIAGTMGKGAAADFLVGTVVREAIPMLFAAGGKLLRGVSRGLQTGHLKGETLDTAIKQISSAKSLPEELRRSLTEMTQDITDFRAQAQAAIDRGLSDITLRPMDRTYVAAQAMQDNIAFVPVEDGGFKLWYFDRGKKIVERAIFKTHDELLDNLGLLAKNHYDTLAPEMKTRFMQGNEWLLRRGMTLDYLDHTINGKSLAEGVSRRRGFIDVSNRSYVGAGEADAIVRAVPDGKVFRASLGATMPNAVPAGWGASLPPYLRQKIVQDFETAQRLGLVEKIDDMSAQRMTAAEIQRALGLPDRDLIRSVRSVLGIPSMDDHAAFAAWLQARGTAQSVGGLTQEMAARVTRSKSLFVNDGPRAFVPDPKGNVLVTIARPAPEEAIRGARGLAEGAIARGATESADTLTARYLAEMGYDGIVTPQGAVSFFPDRAKWITENIDPRTGKLMSEPVRLAKAATSSSNAFFVEGRLRSVAGPEALRRNPRVLASTIDAISKGELDPAKVRNVTRLLTGADNVDVVRAVYPDKVNMAGRAVELTREGERLQVRIPKSINSPEAQRRFIQQYLDDVESIGIKVPKSRVMKLGAEAPRLHIVPPGDGPTQRLWMENTIKQLGGTWTPTRNGIQVRMANGDGGLFGTLDDVGRFISRQVLDEDIVRSAINAQSMSLKRLAGGGYEVMGRNMRTPVRVNDLAQALDVAEIDTVKLSNRFGPKVVEIGADRVTLEYDGVSLRGSVTDAMKTLDSFVDPQVLAQQKHFTTVNGNQVFQFADGGFQLHVPRYGATFNFEDFGEVRRFFSAQVPEFERLRMSSIRKGLSMDYSPRTGWSLSDGNKVYRFKKIAEVQEFMRKTPDATNAVADIFEAIDPQASREVVAVLRDVDPKIVSKWRSLKRELTSWDTNVPEFSPYNGMASDLRSQFSALIDNFDWWRDKHLDRLGFKELKRKLLTMQTSITAYTVENNKAYRVLESIFAAEKGKGLIPEGRRQAVLAYREARNAEELADAVAAYGAPSAHENRILAQLDQLLGKREGTAVSGLAAKFGVQYDRFEESYLSRIREWIKGQGHNFDVNQFGRSEDLLHAVYGPQIPAEVKQWFDNMRTADIVSFAREKDALKVMMKYVSTGNKKLYLDDIWREMDGYMKKNAELIPSDISQRVNRYREEVIGVYQAPGEKTMENVGMGFMRALGATNPADIAKGRDIMKLYFSLNYMATLGFRPVSAVRNALQIFSTFAPRWGNDDTIQGIKKVLAAKPDYFVRLKQLGVISEVPPVVNQIIRDETKFGRLVTKALSMFKNADDLTRAIAYAAVENRFMGAAQKLASGIIKDPVQFMKLSGLNKIARNSPDVVNQVLGEVNRWMSGGAQDAIAISRANYLLANKLVEETMFIYQTANKPMLYSQSLITKLFGQYGTYSAGYRANIWRGFSEGDFADKVGFVTRFMGNNLAIFGLFTALGLKGQDFVPGMPALFGGGPGFDLAVNLMQAADMGYKGAQARNNLQQMISPVVISKTGVKGNIPRIMPGSMQLHFLQKAIEYANEGDGYRMLMSLTMTPLNDKGT